MFPEDKYLQLQLGKDNEPTIIVAGLLTINKDTYVYFGSGWADTNLNPYHELGTLIKEATGRWTFRNDKYDIEGGFITIITEIKETDELYQSAKDWADRALMLDNGVMAKYVGSDRELTLDFIELVWSTEDKSGKGVYI